MKRWLSYFVLLVLAATAALAQTPGPFSADEKITFVNSSNEPLTGKLYYDGAGRMRIDIHPQDEESLTIVDSKKQVFYTLMPQARLYLETALVEIDGRGRAMPGLRTYDASDPCAKQPDYICRKTGTERLNGRTCEKWELTSKRTSARHWVWIDRQNHMPAKTITQDGTVIELKNIRQGRQPVSLFEIPSGYRSVEMRGLAEGLADESE